MTWLVHPLCMPSTCARRMHQTADRMLHADDHVMQDMRNTLNAMQQATFMRHEAEWQQKRKPFLQVSVITTCSS